MSGLYSDTSGDRDSWPVSSLHVGKSQLSLVRPPWNRFLCGLNTRVPVVPGGARRKVLQPKHLHAAIVSPDHLWSPHAPCPPAMCHVICSECPGLPVQQLRGDRVGQKQLPPHPAGCGAAPAARGPARTHGSGARKAFLLTFALWFCFTSRLSHRYLRGRFRDPNT